MDTKRTWYSSKSNSTSPALNFIKNFILHIKIPVNEHKYLKYTPRHIG